MGSASALLGAFCGMAGCGDNGGGNQGDSGSPSTEITITITVAVAQCPLISAIVVAPPAVDVGQSAILTAAIGLAPSAGEAGGGAEAGDDEGGLVADAAVVGSDGGSDAERVSVSWSASSGNFRDATGAETAFTCTTPGTVMVTLTATHEGCQVALAVPVDCLGTEGGSGGD